MKKLPKNWKKKDGLRIMMLLGSTDHEVGIQTIEQSFTVQANENIAPADGCDFCGGDSSRSSQHMFETKGFECKAGSLPGVGSSISAFLYCLPENVKEAKRHLLLTMKEAILIKQANVIAATKLYDKAMTAVEAKLEKLSE